MVVTLSAVVSGTNEVLEVSFREHELNVLKRMGPLIVGLFGVAHRGNAADCTLWIANALAMPTGDVLCGDVHLDYLNLDCDQKTSFLDRDLNQGQGVVCIPSRHQIVRRFAYAETQEVADSLCRYEHFQPELSAAFGVRKDPTPDFDADPLRAHYGGWEGIDAEGKRQFNRSLSESNLRIGPYWPINSRLAGEAGGRWIETSTPYRTQHWMLYWRHAQARNAERMAVCAYHQETLKPITVNDIARANGGVMPWEVHNNSRSLFLPWWKDAPDYGVPTDEHNQQKQAILQWHPHDPEHAIRAFLPDRNLAFEDRDPFAIHQISMVAAHFNHEWADEPVAENRNPKWRDTSLYRRWQDAVQNPGMGTGAGRDLAWMIEVNLTAHALKGDRTMWLRMMRDFLEKSAMPSGLHQRRNYRTYFNPDPHNYGVPEADGASQQIEISLLSCAVAGMVVRGFGDAQLVTRAVDSYAHANGSMPPQKWICFEEIGTWKRWRVYAHNKQGGNEGFQTHRSLYAAYEASRRNRSYLALLLDMVDASSPSEYVDKVAQQSLQHGDRMVHASPGVAYCQSLAI